MDLDTGQVCKWRETKEFANLSDSCLDARRPHLLMVEGLPPATRSEIFTPFQLSIDFP